MSDLLPVAILCTAPRSVYEMIPGVECYDAKRDARSFTGGMPIVAHPPCRSWSAFCAHQAKPDPGEKELGPMCVEWLRKCGGVLEHPAYSRLFDFCNLPKPGEERDGLWTAQVLQTWWESRGTQKRTWLCFSGIAKTHLNFPLTLRGQGGDKRLWQTMPRSHRSLTSRPMAEWLVAAARCARNSESSVYKKRSGPCCLSDERPN